MNDSITTENSNKKNNSQERQQYLTFYSQNEIFAIAIVHVKEIREYSKLTPVPQMPLFIGGVINLRGAAVPVVDLSSRYGDQKSEVTKRSCIVIVEAPVSESETQVIGVLVDAVSEVLTIPASEIEPAPSFGSSFRSDFIEGMGKFKDDEFVIILDVKKMLSAKDLEILGKNVESPEAKSELPDDKAVVQENSDLIESEKNAQLDASEVDDNDK